MSQVDDVGVMVHRHPSVEQFGEFFSQNSFHLVGHAVVLDAVQGSDIVVVGVIAIIGDVPELTHPIDVSDVEVVVFCELREMKIAESVDIGHGLVLNW